MAMDIWPLKHFILLLFIPEYWTLYLKSTRSFLW